jgi:hypothetical protein
MIVLGETNYENGKPTLQYCKSYAQQHGVPLDKIYIDYGNQYGAWETIFSNINPYIPDSGQFSLPWDCVLDGDNMEYIYSTIPGPHPNINEALNQALND